MRSACMRKAEPKGPGSYVSKLSLAMVLYNVGEHREAKELLLRTLAETSADHGNERYRWIFCSQIHAAHSGSSVER